MTSKEWFEQDKNTPLDRHDALLIATDLAAAEARIAEVERERKTAIDLFQHEQDRAEKAEARIAEVEREMAQGKLIAEDAAATAGRAITRAESAERRASELRRYVSIRTICPCCEESVKCHRECTYEHDDEPGWKDMMLARAVLAAGEGEK